MHSRYSSTATRTLLLLSILLIVAAPASAQRVGVWDVVDSTTSRYLIAEPLASASASDHVLVSTGGGISNRVLRTTDAGASWRVVRDVTSQTRSMEVAHPSRDLIVMVGDTAELLRLDGYNGRYRTWSVMTTSRDGGATWEERTLDSNRRLVSIAMASPQEGAIIARPLGNIYDSSAYALPTYLMLTTDAWLTHSTVNLPPTMRLAGRVLSPAPGVLLVEAYDAEAKQTFLHRTTDDGATWTRSQPVPSLRRYDFRTPLDVWGAGGAATGIGQTRRDVIAHSTDGGMTWQLVVNESRGKLAFGLHDISFADDLNGLAVGGASKILRTTDGGATWRQEYIPVDVNWTNDISVVRFTAPDNAFLVSGLGPILRYSGRTALAAPTFTLPTGFEAKPVDSVLIAWRSVDGAVRYRVQVAPQPVDDWIYDEDIFAKAVIDTVLDDTSLVVRDMLHWHRYMVRVKALAESEESGWYENEGSGLFHTEKATGLAAPIIITPPSGSTGNPLTVSVTWRAVGGATSYDLQVGTDRFFAGPIVFSESMLSGTSAVVAGLAPDTEYYVRVRTNAGAEQSPWSSASAPHSFRTTAVASAPDERSRSQARLHPNPASSTVTIELPARAMRGRVELVDALGQRMLTGRIEGSTATIDVSDLSAGLYFVRADGCAPMPLVVRR